MRVLILTFGTEGDVRPYVALARGLRAGGHDAVVGTAEGYRDLVVGAGVPFEPVGNELLELIRTAMPGLTRPGDVIRFGRRMAAAMRSSLLDQWAAAERFRPDVVVYHPKCLGGLHIAERLGVPAVISLALPFFTPTRAFPIPFIARWPFSAANRATYQFNRFTAVAYGAMINRFRRDHLGLAPLSRWTDYLHDSAGRPVPALYAYSPVVVPIPPDYPPHAHVTGYWALDEDVPRRPPADLVDFLATGPQPIYVGLGSMGFSRHAADRGQAVVDAVAGAGTRAVVATGWGGLRIEAPSDRVCVIEQAPHNWLFPRVAAVVHHGGAGTTAAGLRAGRPTLVCPVVGDQGFWGERIRALGAGPAPLPARRLTAARLTPRLVDLVGNRAYRAQAEQLSGRLSTEDGVAAAVQVLEQLAKA